VGPAGMLAHGGGDGDAFCDDQCDWIDCDWYGAGTAREREVHIGHGDVVVWQERPTLYVYVWTQEIEVGD
jgi:hypothetical protein